MCEDEKNSYKMLDYLLCAPRNALSYIVPRTAPTTGTANKKWSCEHGTGDIKAEYF